MVKRYLSTKFGTNIPDGFWENGFYGRTTDDRRQTTDDGRPRDDGRSGVQSHKAELKMGIISLFSFVKEALFTSSPRDNLFLSNIMSHLFSKCRQDLTVKSPRDNLFLSNIMSHLFSKYIKHLSIWLWEDEIWLCAGGTGVVKWGLTHSGHSVVVWPQSHSLPFT